ncbi:hypothetical protein ACA910_000046 [Epithemia clementina (nom. ined.)]
MASSVSSKQELQMEDLLRRFTSSNSSHASCTNGAPLYHDGGGSCRLYPTQRFSAHAALSWSPNKNKETATAKTVLECLPYQPREGGLGFG